VQSTEIPALIRPVTRATHPRSQSSRIVGAIAVVAVAVAVAAAVALASITGGFGRAFGNGVPTTFVKLDEPERPQAEQPDVDTPVDKSDGFIGNDVVSAFDANHPAIARMNPGVLEALRAATVDARRDNIVMKVNSGWRSSAYQDHLFKEAVITYGSVEEASRWVKPADQSTHVTGHAVDIGDTDAAYWMNQHGATYGLCQTYANEIWHYELLIEPGGTCPAPLADATSGPIVLDS
jgi:zinc D-Ala-D-Ala carboxypeptidase